MINKLNRLRKEAMDGDIPGLERMSDEYKKGYIAGIGDSIITIDEKDPRNKLNK